MKKLIISLTILCFVMSFAISLSFAHTEDNPLVRDLIADGGSIDTAVDVGDILIWNDANNLYVKYVTVSGWCITETHLDVATVLGAIPQKNGNPIPGQFAYKDGFNCGDAIPTYVIPLVLPTGTPLYIAAHAVVWSAENLTVVSDTNTQVIEVNGSLVDPSVDAVLAKEPVGYPNCNSYIEDANNSAWDNGIGSSYTTTFTNAEAHWIWNTPHPENPILGDVVVFQETFPVDGLPFNTDLLITADNAFIAALNGAYVGSSISLGPGFPGTLKEQIISVPQDDSWEVASQGWQKVESLALGGIVSGENTLTIIAANEYMCGGNATICNDYLGNDRYYGWNNTSKVYTSGINNDPIPGNGQGVYPCYNPGGLIFKASVDYYREETAWGWDNDFTGKNWAKYIIYHFQ